MRITQTQEGESKYARGTVPPESVICGGEKSWMVLHHKLLNREGQIEKEHAAIGIAKTRRRLGILRRFSSIAQRFGTLILRTPYLALV